MNNASSNATDANYNTPREVITITAATRGAHMQDELEAPMSVEEQNRAQRALDELAIAALVLHPGTQQRNRAYGTHGYGEHRNALDMPTRLQYKSDRFIASRVHLVQQQHEREYIAMCYNPSILFCISEYAHRIELAARRIARLKWTPSQLLQGTQEFLVARERAVTLERRHNRVPGSGDAFYYSTELSAEAFTASIVEMPQRPDYYEPL